MADDGGTAVFDAGGEHGFGAAVNPSTLSVGVPSGTTNKFTFTKSYIPFGQTRAITKTGGGTLWFYRTDASRTDTSIQTGLGDDSRLDILEGTFLLQCVNAPAMLGTPLIYVAPGARLETAARASLGCIGDSTLARVRLAGELRLSMNTGKQGYNSVRELSLEGGTIMGYAQGA